MGTYGQGADRLQLSQYACRSLQDARKEIFAPVMMTGHFQLSEFARQNPILSSVNWSDQRWVMPPVALP